MKVYIDCELPKSCANCFNQHCRIGCKKNCYEPIIKKEYLTSRPKECPLQSLSEHNKQVRKEVCEEIKDKLKLKEMFHPEDEFEIDYDFYYKEDVEEVLDQLSGETNE